VDNALAQNILDRLQVMSTQLNSQGQMLATGLQETKGINQRLDILNGRVGKGEARLVALETASAVAEGRARLIGLLWSIVGAALVTLAQIIAPMFFR
jgi:hypothetical protein